jgi:glycosyltransferase involved in cell wall biosynthesis
VSAAPLVSILIPAYHERFFAESFASARAQRYPALEIVVRDDSDGRTIEDTAARAHDERVRYVRNSPRLGFHGNFTALFEDARGEYVKFLNDDDRLLPQCVPVLAGILAVNPAVALATSRRFVIDELGQRQPDRAATQPLSHVSAFVPGAELGNFVLMNMLNLIGEPTTAMFRRRDLEPEPGGIFRWDGHDYHCLADLSLWLRLLARGAAFYCADALSEYRLHPGQEQETAGRLSCLLERRRIARRARAVGYLAGEGQYAAALEAARDFALGTDFARTSPEVERQVREELRILDEEISRAAGERLASPL